MGFDFKSKYIDDICSKNPVLSSEKQSELISAWKKTGNKQLLDKLILSNIKLVISETNKIMMHNSYASYDDLFQEGLSGLMKAADKFDETKDSKFSTYSIMWIKAYQKRYIMNNRSMVRLGTTRSGRVIFGNLARARSKAERMGLEGDAKIIKIAKILKVNKSEVEKMMGVLSGFDESLDKPIGDEDSEGNFWINNLPDSNDGGNKAFEDASLEEYSSLAKMAIHILNEDEKFIIQNRFLNKNPMTLKDIASHFKISREWARKLETRTLDRMRKYLAREHNVREI